MSRLPPSRRTRQRARQRGIVPYSGLAVAAAATLTATLCLRAFGPAAAAAYAEAVKALWTESPSGSFVPLAGALRALTTPALELLVPTLVLIWTATMFAGWAQTRFNLATAFWHQGPPGPAGLWGPGALLRRTARLAAGGAVGLVALVAWVQAAPHLGAATGAPATGEQMAQWAWPLHKLVLALLGAATTVAIADLYLARVAHQRRLGRTPGEARREDHGGSRPLVAARRNQEQQRLRASPAATRHQVLALVDASGRVGVILAYAPPAVAVPQVARIGRALAFAPLLAHAAEHHLPVVEAAAAARSLADLQTDDPIPRQLYNLVAGLLSEHCGQSLPSS